MATTRRYRDGGAVYWYSSPRAWNELPAAGRYYFEGLLLWNGGGRGNYSPAKSGQVVLDDFCHKFYGGPGHWPDGQDLHSSTTS